jgi:hypothetical protein
MASNKCWKQLWIGPNEDKYIWIEFAEMFIVKDEKGKVGFNSIWKRYNEWVNENSDKPACSKFILESFYGNIIGIQSGDIIIIKVLPYKISPYFYFNCCGECVVLYLSYISFLLYLMFVVANYDCIKSLQIYKYLKENTLQTNKPKKEMPFSIYQ